MISTPTPNNPALRTVATPGVDYYIAFITPEEIKFGRDQTTHTFKIQIVNDEEPEIDEYFEVKLSEMDCPVLGDAAITVRIQDDDSKCFESYVVWSSQMSRNSQIIIDLEIEPNKGNESFCFLLFWQLFNRS